MKYSTYEALDRIRKRPGMYIGEVTMENLRAYLSGYWMAMKDIGAEDTASLSFDNFSKWLVKRLKGRDAPYGWGNMILAFSKGDNPDDVQWESYLKETDYLEHKRSVEYFYHLLDEYRNEGLA